MPRPVLLAGTLVALVVPGAAAGQEAARAPAVPSWRPVALSALVPGAGQLLLEERRGWLYLALEAAGWVAWTDRRGAAASFRAAYRDHAWERARTWDGPRIDGDFPYYERMGQWTSSGRYDTEPGRPGLQPEADPSTYNGAIWARARGLFLPPGAVGEPGEEGYEAALDYYRSRAYGEEFLWDWSDDPAARAAHGELIEAGDARARQATTVLGVILANHLLSAVDAFLSGRGVTGYAGLGPVPASRSISEAVGGWHLVISWRTR